jgi:hypothetical protein
MHGWLALQDSCCNQLAAVANLLLLLLSLLLCGTRSYSCELVDEGGHDMGMLLFSSHGGWSALDRDSGDPRPSDMDPAVRTCCCWWAVVAISI